jgi:AcrR family transcriptional regulator
MSARDKSDLTAAARIRNAALTGFATHGTKATSIRDVAEAAGVSPGLVQHHFGNKAGLRKAVDEHVLNVVGHAFVELANPDVASFESVGRQITETAADQADALLYVARLLAEEDPAAIELFQAFVTIAKGNLAALIDAGAVDPEVDVDWAAMHTTIFVLGSILFQRAVSQQLGKSLLDRDELERWHRASTDLFQRGLAPPTDRTAP